MPNIHIFEHDWLVYTLPKPEHAARYDDCAQYEVPDELIARFYVAYRQFKAVQRELEAIYEPSPALEPLRTPPDAAYELLMPKTRTPPTPDVLGTIERLIPHDLPLSEMFWLNSLQTALGTPALVDAFRQATGLHWTPGRTPLDRMIDQTTGIEAAFLVAFIEWFHTEVWGHESPPAPPLPDYRDARGAIPYDLHAEKSEVAIRRQRDAW